MQLRRNSTETNNGKKILSRAGQVSYDTAKIQMEAYKTRQQQGNMASFCAGFPEKKHELVQKTMINNDLSISIMILIKRAAHGFLCIRC